ncbi:MAG: hypothetical protein QGG53_39365 [Planctomycetota bacterium]|nr:hypothetical protein [Planctomycetota bacterium]
MEGARERRTDWMRWILGAVAVFVTCLVVFFAWHYDRYLCRQFDAVARMLGAERMYLLGGQVYETTVDQKGPLWTNIYYVTYLLGGNREAAWSWLGAVILFTNSVVAFSIYCITPRRVLAHVRALRIGACLAIFYYLSASEEEWAFLFYSRNMTSAMIAVSFALIWWGVRIQKYRIHAFVLAGLTMGQVVSIMPTSGVTFALMCILAAACCLKPGNSWAVSLRESKQELLQSLGVLILAWSVSFLFVFVYYWLTGNFSRFWSYWYRYNLFYTDVSGQNPLQILMKLFSDLRGFFFRHYLFTAVLIGYILLLIVKFRGASRTEQLFMTGNLIWLTGEAISMGLGQRFFDHYEVLLVIPLCQMAVVVLTFIGDRINQKHFCTFTAVAIPVFCLWYSCSAMLAIGHSLSPFGNPEQTRKFYTGPDSQPLLLAGKAAVDLLTEEDEFIYAWMREPQLVAFFERPCASRYIECRWLSGTLTWAGKWDRKFLLDGVWQNWSEDLARSKPRIIIHDFSDAIPEGSSLEKVIDADYELVVSHPGYRVYSRQGMLEALLRKLQTESFQDWSSVPRTKVKIEDSGVFVLQGEIELSDFSEYEILINDRESREPIAAFKLTGLKEVLSSRWSHGRYLKALRAATDRAAGKYPFMLVVRNASASLLLDGRYIGGVPVVRGEMNLMLQSNGDRGLSNLTFWAGTPLPE